MRSLFGKLEGKVETEGSPVNEGTLEEHAPETVEKEETEKRVKIHRTKNVYFEKRIKSELHLEEVLPWHFEKGAAYHCISFGDVDSLTFLRVIVKQQPLEYVIVSTWCMAITDIKEIEKWLERKDVGRVDFYVGEIFQGSYAEVYLCLKKVAERFNSRVCVFRNHAKVMAGFGRDFDFVIESSANINTNPRTEQTCITVDTGLARFYKNIFDEINNFTKDFDYWKPYTLNRDKENETV